MNKFDVIVVGSGTSGYTAAKECRKEGMSVAVVESGVPGGVCALHGCQPKKFFVVQSELLRLGQHLKGKGVSNPPTLNWSETAAFKNDFTDAVPENTQAFFKKIGADFFRGSARFTSSATLTVGDDELNAEVIILATGSSPRLLDIPGGELALNSNEFLAQTELPDSIIFIGGGYISFEFAHMASAFGAQVTVLNKSERVLRPFDSELVDTTVAASEDAGIAIRTGQIPVEILRTPTGLKVKCKNGSSYEAAAVFAATGREANLQELNLEALDLAPDPRGLKVDSQMRVAGRSDLYAIGDCARTKALAPVADREALVAASNIAGKLLEMDYRTVPSVCFTQPPLASVGLSVKQAQELGLSYIIREGKTTGWANQRRLGARFGQYKLLIDDDGMLLGAHILDHGAGDMINMFAMAMKYSLPASVFTEMMWAYPTLTADTKYMV